MREAAPAVEEARDRVRKQGAAGRGPGHHFDALEQRPRQHINQILSESPDRRGIPEELMGIEIDAAVVPVAVVEMAVDHQHARVLEILQGFGAKLPLFVHVGPQMLELVNSSFR